MAAILQIRRGTGSVSLSDGELYLNKETQSLQIGSNEGVISLAKLNSTNSGSFYVSGDITLGGTITIGDSTTDNIVINADLNSDIIPNIHKQYNLGNDSKWYKNIYVETVSASFISASFIQGVGNISEFSTSVDSRLDQLENASASLQLFSASQESKDLTLAQYTGSVNDKFVEVQASTSSLNTFTASASGRLNNLEITSASHNGRLNNLETYSQSLRDAITVSGVGVSSTTTVRGDLFVQGTTTTVNSTTIQLGDNIIELNGNGALNAGLLVKDPTNPNTVSGSLLWDATNDYWIGGALGAESKFLRAGGDNVFSSSAQFISILDPLNSFTSSQENKNSTLASYTGSIDDKFIAVQNSTSSLNNFTSSVENKFLAVAYSTSSLNTFTASVTASVIELFWTASDHETRIDLLEAGGVGSINILNEYTASAENKFLAIQASTSSLNAFTASVTASVTQLFWTASDHETRIDILEGVAFGGLDLDELFLAVQASTSSLNAFTASANTRLGLLENSTGSLNAFTASANTRLGLLENSTGSLNLFTESANTRLGLLENSTGSLNNYTSSNDDKFISVGAFTSSLNTFTTSALTRFTRIEESTSSLNEFTASQNSKNLTLASYTGSVNDKFTAIGLVTESLNSKTGSYAITGSNTFYGNQIVSGSLTVTQDFIVLGSSSIQNISSSTLDIGTNLIKVNVNQPSIRFGGFAVVDSGSAGSSGSFLYDALEDEFIFVHRGDGVNITSSHFVLGPETYNNLGNETYLTLNKLPKGTGKEHLVDSNITDDGTTITLATNTSVTGRVTATGFSGSIAATNGVVSGSSQLTASYDIRYALSGSTSINTGSFAITGSNTFRGNQIISASVLLSGSLAVGNITPSTTAGRIDAANDIVAYSTSDIRFKENITPIENALIKVKQIGGYEFDWKEENKIEHGYEGHDLGVIAQEIEAIAPELVKTRESGYKAVKYDKLVSVLIEAIKELSARIDKLENK